MLLLLCGTIDHYYELNVSPQNRYTGVLTPSTSEGSSVGLKASTENTQVEWGRGGGASPNVTGSLGNGRSRSQRPTYTGRTPSERESRDRGDAATSQGTPENASKPPELGLEQLLAPCPQKEHGPADTSVGDV